MSDEVLVEIIPISLNAQDVQILVPRTLSLNGPPHHLFWTEPWRFGEHPGETVKFHLRQQLKAEPLILHSTSWRTVQIAGQSRIILTYLAVMPAQKSAQASFMAVPVELRTCPIAQSDSTSPPPEIFAWQVARHALEHLHWLSHTDDAIQARLSDDWLRKLDSFGKSAFLAY